MESPGGLGRRVGLPDEGLGAFCGLPGIRVCFGQGIDSAGGRLETPAIGQAGQEMKGWPVALIGPREHALLKAIHKLAPGLVKAVVEVLVRVQPLHDHATGDSGSLAATFDGASLSEGAQKPRLPPGPLLVVGARPNPRPLP